MGSCAAASGVRGLIVMMARGTFGLMESHGMAWKVLVAARLPPRRSFSVQSDTGFATGRLRPSCFVRSSLEVFASHMSCPC